MTGERACYPASAISDSRRLGTGLQDIALRPQPPDGFAPFARPRVTPSPRSFPDFIPEDPVEHVVPLDLANGHDRTEAVKQILFKSITRNIDFEPFNRSRGTAVLNLFHMVRDFPIKPILDEVFNGEITTSPQPPSHSQIDSPGRRNLLRRRRASPQGRLTLLQQQ